jgi:hypothetical protein
MINGKMMNAHLTWVYSLYLAEKYETGRSCGMYSNKTSTQSGHASVFAIFTPVFRKTLDLKKLDIRQRSALAYKL